MSAAYDFKALLPDLDRLDKARKALRDANVIAEILGSLGTGDISGGKPICGTMLVFLAEQLSGALEPRLHPPHAPEAMQSSMNLPDRL